MKLLYLISIPNQSNQCLIQNVCLITEISDEFDNKYVEVMISIVVTVVLIEDYVGNNFNSIQFKVYFVFNRRYKRYNIYIMCNTIDVQFSYINKTKTLHLLC